MSKYSMRNKNEVNVLDRRFNLFEAVARWTGQLAAEKIPNS